MMAFALVAGCQQGPLPLPPSTQPPAAAVAAVLDAAVLDAATLDAATPDAAIEDAGTPPPVTDVDVDVDAWLAARGAPRTQWRQEADGCSEIKIGTAAEAALVCEETEEVSLTTSTSEVPPNRVVAHRTIHVVRAKHVVTVLDVIVTVGVLDEPSACMAPFGRIRTENPMCLNIMEASMHLAPDGRSATVDAAPARERCNAPHADRAKDDEWERFDRDLVRRTCAGIGHYSWRGGRFVRDARR